MISVGHAAIPFFRNASGASGGQRFCVLHRPTGSTARGAVLYVHPFAEEMNKSRRMAAMQSRALALAGYAVLQVDLLGCGDSSGDFGDATWDHWLDDLLDAANWLDSQFHAPLTLWGLRAGCLVAAAAAQRAALECDFLFWQPMTAGKLVVQQFLRLDMAKDMLQGQTKGSTDKLRGRLLAGESIDIAGYSLHPALAHGLDRATLLPTGSGRSIWLEVSTRDEPMLLPATSAAIQVWTGSGRALSNVVKGPAFWSTSEMEEAPALIEATLSAMARTANAPCAA